MKMDCVDFVRVSVYSFVAFVAGAMLFSACSFYKTNNEKHFYLGYGDHGYMHVPTNKKDTWLTYEVIAPKYEEVK